jgi:hypothetical protein
MSMPASNKLPDTAGINLRATHYRTLLEHRPAPGWLDALLLRGPGKWSLDTLLEKKTKRACHE